MYIKKNNRFKKLKLKKKEDSTEAKAQRRGRGL